MYKENIQAAIDYIEDNLRTEITAAEAAEKAGYSVFHFYRIFQNTVGMPVMQYILRRKLFTRLLFGNWVIHRLNTSVNSGPDSHTESTLSRRNRLC